MNPTRIAVVAFLLSPLLSRPAAAKPILEENSGDAAAVQPADSSDQSFQDQAAEVKKRVRKHKSKAEQALQEAPGPGQDASKPPAGKGFSEDFSGDAGERCGEERWHVKTLDDSESNIVMAASLNVSTVHDLRQIPPPPQWPPAQRMPIEKQVVTVKAVLIGAKMECADHDYHLVLANPDDPSETMIAEVTDPKCWGADASAELPVFQAARLSYNQQFGTPAGDNFVKFPQPIPVVVKGVGFFDKLHGQTGVAPNGIELHPVLSITRQDGVAPSSQTDFADPCAGKEKPLKQP